MDDRTFRSRARTFAGIALAVAAISAVLYLASGDAVVEDEGLSYWSAFAVVSLVALTAWALVAARSRIRSQAPPAIEQLPSQPGDVRAAERVRAHEQKSGGATQRVPAHASTELASLHGTVDAGASSPAAYHEHLEPLLREIASDRAERAGAEIDLETLVGLERRLPGTGGIHGLLMRVPAYRRRVIMRAIVGIINNIEEI